MSVATVMTIVGAALAAEVWRSHFSLRRHMKRAAAPEPLAHYPSITVIRPVKGIDAGAEENLRAALVYDYPGKVETLFVVDDANEPALPLILSAILNAQSSMDAPWARVVFAGPPPEKRTGKLNAMIAGLREARGALIAFVDSDTRADRDALRVLVDTLVASPRAGAAFAPVVVTEPARTVGDAGYALLLNGMYGPAAAAEARRNGGSLPFIMGQFMVIKRQAIEAIGGLECAEGQFVDDMYLGASVHQAGYRNMVSPHRVPIIQHGLDLSAFAAVYLRWIVFSRSGLAASFKQSSWLRGAVFWAGIVLAAVSLVFGAWWAMLVGALVPVMMTASINMLHRAHGSAPLRWRHRWVAFALLLVGPVVLLATRLRRQINWRGRVYTLNAEARLATVDPTDEPMGPLAELAPPPTLSSPGIR